MVTREEIQRFIRSEVDRGFFEQIELSIPQTFQKALEDSQQLLHTPQEHLRGQLRHCFVQEAMGAMKHWVPIIRDTDPKGSYYVLLALGRLRITSVVLPWQKDVRPAKYRTELKTLNESLAATQVDWIDKLTQPSCEQLMHALVIVQAPPPGYFSQAEPLGITVAVPYFNGKGFHMSCTLRELIDGYVDVQEADSKDVAWTKLRDKMQHAEDANDQADG